MQNNKEVLNKVKSKAKDVYGKGKNFANSNTKLYIACVAVFVGIIILVIGLNTGLGTKEESNSNTDNTIEIKHDEIPEINTLITQYYTAIISADTTTLVTLVDNPEKYANAELKKTIDISYNNISCYTAPGLEENTYVVFVYYEVKVVNATALGPGIDTFYVVQDQESGKYLIHSDTSEDIANYMNTVAQNEEIATLFEDTNAKLTQALASDATLKAFYDKYAAQETTTEETTTTEQTTTAAQ